HISYFLIHCHYHLPDLHSFPTRRSSDLALPAGGDPGGERSLVGFSGAHRAPRALRDGPSRSIPTIGPEESTRPSSLTRFHENLRSEEHTSELQSLAYLVCRLLLEKKNKR